MASACLPESQAFMPTNHSEVLATRDARAQLPAILERFRAAGPDAEPVVIGAQGRPEAVFLSYEHYLELAGGGERVRAILDRQAPGTSKALDANEALELANRELHSMRRERRGERT
jgi:hypothetical protein